jgi:geranylgeranyl diphosphate synthase type II
MAEKALLVQRYLSARLSDRVAERLLRVGAIEVPAPTFAGRTITERSWDPSAERSSALGSAGFRQVQASMRYSALQEGGKRFRPALAMMTAEALGHSAERALPLAAAIECIHTYSLIHDDLPAMDNDDWRRGQPTNHKKFDEPTAILAGDALLTEAFSILSEAYAAEPAAGLQAVAAVAHAAGLYGMVGGQAIDVRAKTEEISISELETMHTMKTGALIRAAGQGAAIVCFATPDKIGQATQFAESLGLAFQVADDLLDHVPATPEPGSFPAFLGYERTQAYLKELTERCLAMIEAWPASAEPLRALARFNKQRLH